MQSTIINNSNSPSWLSAFSSPYRNGWKHLNMALQKENQVFKEAKNFLHCQLFTTLSNSQRVSHFLKGVVLCIPIVNVVAEAATRILFPSYSQNYTKPAAWKRINHIVVLMLENRSFDNMLGGLYPKSSSFNGLSGTEENSYIDKAGVKHTLQVWNSQGARMDTPNPDPGEIFTDMTYQLFNTHQPLLKTIPPMSGFAQNFYDFICRDKDAQKELRKKRGLPDDHSECLEPTEEEVNDIMHFYAPEQVPVITQLGRSFGVSDMYHASAPNQTWPNRFFVHTGTANSYVNNSPFHFPYTMKTVFTRFNDLRRNNGWKIYFHDLPQSATLSDLWPHPKQFKHFNKFLEDSKKGRLPSYSFIEPRFYRENEFPSDQHPPHDVRHGEQLMAEVYNALRKSPQWKDTLFVITYDEHGGCYDHQPPPPATPPESPKPGQEFNFDRYGVRVPAVFISPHIAPNTILRPPDGSQAPVFDHTSIITSVRNCFALGAPLTQRDRVAPDLSSVLNMPEGTYNMGPEEIIAPPAPQTGIEEAKDLSMSDLQTSLLQMAQHLPDHSKLHTDQDYLINSVKKPTNWLNKPLLHLKQRLCRELFMTHLVGVVRR